MIFSVKSVTGAVLNH